MEFYHNTIYKDDFTINDLLIGSLLGDACLNKDGRIEIWHCEKQKEYTLWLMNLYKKYFKVKYRERVCKDKKTDREFNQVGFCVSSTKRLKLLRTYLYCPQKCFNMKQLKKLSPLGLAIWYMDDGCLSFIKDKQHQIKARQLILNTQAYSFEEQEMFVTYFKEVWDIECHIHIDHNSYRLWMNSTEGTKLLSIISPYMPPCMYYKVCYRYFGYKSSNNLCKKSCSKDCPYHIV